MKTKINVIISIFVVVLLTSFGGSKLRTESHNSKLKIGIYDSRAVTYAYTNSVMFKQGQQKINKENSEILKSKDTAKWKETMTKIFTEQYLLHQRVFATGSATSILKKIESQLPAVAKNAGVDIIVSKWELTWNDSNASLIDLTDSIAQLFVPIDKLGNVYTEIKKADKMEVDDFDVGEVIEMWQQFEKKYLGK